jgi:hypothetical protein
MILRKCKTMPRLPRCSPARLTRRSTGWNGGGGWSRNATCSRLIAVMRQGKQRGVIALHRQQRRIHALANWYSFRVRPLFTTGADMTAMLNELAADLAGESPHLSPRPPARRER